MLIHFLHTLKRHGCTSMYNLYKAHHLLNSKVTKALYIAENRCYIYYVSIFLQSKTHIASRKIKKKKHRVFCFQNCILNITYVHIQLVNFRKHPSNWTISTAHEYTKRIEMPKKTKTETWSRRNEIKHLSGIEKLLEPPKKFHTLIITCKATKKKTRE